MTETKSPSPIEYYESVSPYLLRPLRSYDQAIAEIASRKKRANTVTPFIPVLVTTEIKTDICAERVEAGTEKKIIAA